MHVDTNERANVLYSYKYGPHIIIPTKQNPVKIGNNITQYINNSIPA